MLSNSHKQLIENNIIDQAGFIKATFSGRQRGHTIPWHKVVVRPVLIKNKRHIQISRFDAQKDISQNYADSQIIKQKIDELLELPFKNIHLQTSGLHIQLQITKKGKTIVHRHKAPPKPIKPSLEHDRPKNLLLPAGQPDPFLHKIGIMTQDGKVKAKMQKKFRQINEFLKLLVETGELEKVNQYPLNIVDCGCGNAYLTFATYHYLNHILNLPTHIIGLDTNEAILESRLAHSQDLNWQNLIFQATRIIDFQPPAPPDIVLALHACDTATDEALAQAVKWHSKMIFSAPCCHHHLQQQLAQQTPPPPFSPILRHGVLKERLGDILTDSFRSLILRIMGYRPDIVEFVSTEHTGKNLMIRAIKAIKPDNHRAIQQYKALKEFWQVKPYLEQLLERELYHKT